MEGALAVTQSQESFNKYQSSSSCVLQEPELPVDDEMLMLQCTETFDDEDL